MARVISLKTPKKHRRIERTLQAKSARVLHADRRAHQLVFPRARRGFCVDFHDIYDDRRKIPGAVRHRVLLLLFDCDRIFGVSHISRRLGYEEKARVAQNRLPCSQSQLIACATSTCLLYRQIYGYVALGVSIAIAIAVFALCLWKFNVFRNVSVISSFVIGALMLAAFFTAYFSPIGISAPTCFVFLAGLVSCLLGAAVFGVHKRYVHCVFHFFVLAGPVLFLVATYLQIIGK